MASYVPAKYGTEYIFYVGLESSATAGAFQSNPTLASGDFKLSKDGGALTNLTTLPTVTPAGGKLVKITLSATEMQCDNANVVCSDASGGEWKDLVINIQTATRQFDDLAYPTTSGRSIDVSAGGEVGIDWANIGSPTTTVNLSGTTVKTATDVETDTQDIQARLPASLVSGRMDSSVGAMAAGVVTATAIATDAIDADALASDAVTEIQSGLATSSALTTLSTKLGTPAGASVSADIAAVKSDSAAILDDTGTSGVVVASGSKSGYSLASDQSGVTVGTVNALGTQAKADVNAEADTALSDVGLTTTITGRIDVAVSTRLATSGYTAPDNSTVSAINTKLGTPAGASVSADIASVQSDTNDLQTQIGSAGAGLTAVASAANLATLTGYVDTEVAAIKAKTDNLPASPAATGDIPSTSAIVTAIMAYAVETGHSVETVLEALYAVIRGKSVADDADNPTQVVYYAPDGTTARVTHTLTDTERTAS